MDITKILKDKDKIPSVLDELSGKIKTELETTFSNIRQTFGDKLKVGYNESGYNGELGDCHANWMPLIFMVTNYCSLLKGKKPSLDVIREIYNLPIQLKLNELTAELKKLYLIWNKVYIPNVPLKIDKLIEVYDFPASIEKTITNIVNAGLELGKFRIENVDEFYDETLGTLLIPQQMKDEIHEEHAQFLSEQGVIKLFKLHLLCEAINSLSDPSYLPELEFKTDELNTP